MVKVNWSPQALEDVDNIADYIARDSIHFAKIQVRRFFDFAVILESSPLSGRIVPEIGIKSIRELLVGNYRIVYRLVNKKQIDVLTIHHSARILRRSMLKRGRT